MISVFKNQFFKECHVKLSNIVRNKKGDKKTHFKIFFVINSTYLKEKSKNSAKNNKSIH